MYDKSLNKSLKGQQIIYLYNYMGKISNIVFLFLFYIKLKRLVKQKEKKIFYVDTVHILILSPFTKFER